MAGRTSSDFIETVRGASDIVQVISDYVPLKRAGARLKGLCPFHQEKTPSFSVDPSAQLFYCFGCQTGGDVFKFVQLYDKVDFREAAELLARRFGIPIPARGGRPGPGEGLYKALRAAETFFRERLRGAGGRGCREYLQRRGLGDDVVDGLALGFAPDSWDALLGHLGSRGFTPGDLLAAGLVLERKDRSGFYDRFRNRLMFPIRDVSGRTVAFGGRILGEGEPKYLNSPETRAYTKGSHLYGLDRAREAIRREGFVIVVEGYLDSAALLEAGFGHAVASLGTALTPGQVQLLARYTDRVVVAYDGDSAGATATVRSLDLLLARGLEVRIVELPEGQDPDDFIRDQGSAAFAARVGGAPSYLDWLVRREADGRDLDRPGEQVAAVNAVLPHLVRLSSPIERASWAGRLADALHIDDELVLQELAKALRAGGTRVRQRAAGAAVPLNETESRMVSLLLRFAEARTRARAELDERDLAGTRVAGIVEAVLRLDDGAGEVEYRAVFSALEHDDDRELLTRIAFRDEPEASAAELDECIRSLRRRRLMRERRELQRRLQAAEAGAVDALLLQTQELARQIDALNR